MLVELHILEMVFQLQFRENSPQFIGKQKEARRLLCIVYCEEVNNGNLKRASLFRKF